MGVERAEVILLMKKAIALGQSASSFITDMRSAKLSYRRTTMLADWRSVGEIEKKTDLMKYVRKDYYPTEKTIAQVEWKLSREYMYKVKVETRVRPGEPIAERFVNIMSDKPLTPGQVESEVFQAWGEWEKYSAEQVTRITPWTAIHKVME